VDSGRQIAYRAMGEIRACALAPYRQLRPLRRLRLQA
jgi:hypothetical protein